MSGMPHVFPIAARDGYFDFANSFYLRLVAANSFIGQRILLASDELQT